jgi:hypothetical protein
MAIVSGVTAGSKCQRFTFASMTHDKRPTGELGRKLHNKSRKYSFCFFSITMFLEEASFFVKE